MQIIIDTDIDNEREYRAARAALESLLETRSAAPLLITPGVQDDDEDDVPPPLPIADPVAQYVALGGALPPAEEPQGDGSGLDIHGIPWDARIHSDSKNKNKDGSWRVKRNSDPAYVAAITAELRGGAAVSPAPAPQPPAIGALGVPLPPTTITPPAPPVPPSGPSFMDVVEAQMPLLAANKITPEQVVIYASQFGLTSVAALQARADLIPAFLAGLGALTSGKLADGQALIDYTRQWREIGPHNQAQYVAALS